MPEDNVIVTLRKTRKAFLPEYLCGAFLLSLLLIAEVRHFEAPSATSRIIIGLALLSFMSAEDEVAKKVQDKRRKVNDHRWIRQTINKKYLFLYSIIRPRS